MIVIVVTVTYYYNNRSDSNADKQTSKIKLKAVKHITGQLHQTTQTTH